MERSQLTTHKNPHQWRKGMKIHMEKMKMRDNWMPAPGPWPTCSGQVLQPQERPSTSQVSQLSNRHSRASHASHPNLRAWAQGERGLLPGSRTGQVSGNACLPVLGSLLHLFPAPGGSGLLWRFHRAQILAMLQCPALGWLHSTWRFYKCSSGLYSYILSISKTVYTLKRVRGPFATSCPCLPNISPRVQRIPRHPASQHSQCI